MNSSSEVRSERAFGAAEALLAHLHPREDAGAAVQTLREHFGSADAAFRADAHALESLGLRADDALLLSRLTELSRRVQGMRFERHPRLARLREASDYLVALYHGLQVERFYLLCLDARGRLRERILLQEGTSDGALFSLRRMLAETLRAGADAVIISHNHPGLTLRPSRDDLACTLEAIRALTAVGVPLLDHVIVAGRQAVSLRLNGFIPADQWLAQRPEHRLLYGWLEEDSPGDA